MKIAISNLAWARRNDEKVLKILKKYKIKAIEVAPSKVLQISSYRRFWNENGVRIVATTSLLYGHEELTVFGTPEKTITYLKKQTEIAFALGAKVMMFGSPKNRIKGNLSKKEAEEASSSFFRKIADFTSQYKICFAIEPNPPIYGGDFILNTNEAIRLVKKVDHKNFGINLDASTLASNEVDYDQTVKEALPYTCHAHISEPYLKPIPAGITDHKSFARALKRHKYDKWVSIEMPLQDNTENFKQIEKTLEFVTKTYRDYRA